MRKEEIIKLCKTGGGMYKVDGIVVKIFLQLPNYTLHDRLGGETSSSSPSLFHEYVMPLWAKIYFSNV
jgi:hypothetical protein